MQGEIAAMQEEIAAAAKGHDARGSDLAVYINGALLTKAFDVFGALPQDARTVTVRTASYGGRIAENVTGGSVKLGYYLELEGDAVRGSMTLGVPKASFVPGKGLALSLPVSGEAQASLHGHVYAVIGGGVGLHPALGGSFSTTLSSEAALRVLDTDGHKVVALVSTIKDAGPGITLKSDSSIDGHRLPSIEVTGPFSIKPDALAPIRIVDDTPRRIMQKDTKMIDWSANTIVVRPKPKVVETTNEGFFVGLDVDVTTSDKTADNVRAVEAAGTAAKGLEPIRRPKPGFRGSPCRAQTTDSGLPASKYVATQAG